MKKREEALLFIDTYQNTLGKIVAVACKLRNPDKKWFIYIHSEQIPADQLETLKQLYYNIPNQDWLDSYLKDVVSFDLKSYYSNRYENIEYTTEDEFLDALLTYDFTLVETGEQLTWFNRFIRKIRLAYSIRTFSLSEVGDERVFTLPVYYSKTDQNEIKSRIDSIKSKITELVHKFGDAVYCTTEMQILAKSLKASVGK